MQTKLTLRMDDELIERAKAFARSRDQSLSELVAGYLRSLTAPPEQRPLSAWVRGLIGAGLRPGETPPTDEELMNDYIDYLEKKYE